MQKKLSVSLEATFPFRAFVVAALRRHLLLPPANRKNDLKRP